MYFSKGNRKLSKNILVWNLPRLITCPGAGECKKWCYETKFERMYKNVLPCRMQNYRESKCFNFDDIVTQYLNNRKEKYVRIHESGDFYNQEYLDHWKWIAILNPRKKFYAYTKSFHLKFGHNHLIPNLRIIQSYGSKWDHLIDPDKPTFKAMPKWVIPNKHEFLCPGGGCGDTCTACMGPHAKKHVVIYIHR